MIHDWDDERAGALLRTCRSAMTEGARLLLIEMVVPAGNTPAYAKLLIGRILGEPHSADRFRRQHHRGKARSRRRVRMTFTSL